MKIRFSLVSKLLLIGTVSLLGYTGLEAREQKREQRLESLKKEFKDPSKEYRSAPLWV